MSLKRLKKRKDDKARVPPSKAISRDFLEALHSCYKTFLRLQFIP